MTELVGRLAEGLPDFPEWTLPSVWQRVDFISDLHLGEETPRAVDAWASYLDATSADAVFILGDLFEAWLGDDSRHTGFEARCAAVLAHAGRSKRLAFMVGNRDFLVGPGLLDACGVMPLADPTVLVAFGQRLLVTHGDALCLDDLEYQAIRRTVRDPAWQAAALSHTLDERRVLARRFRARSELHQRRQEPGVWFDIDRAAALQWMKAAAAPLLVHGHTHRPDREELAPGCTRHVLGDWELDEAGSARADVLRWQDGSLTRLTLDDAAATATVTAADS